MKDDPLDPEIEKLLAEVKLKELRPEAMQDYLSKVHSKIALKQNQTQFHFVTVSAAAAVVLALAGLIYWILAGNQIKEEVQIPTVSKMVQPALKTAPTSNLSLDEELAILEAFSEDYLSGTSDLLGDEGTIEDLVLMDELELTMTPSPSGSI